MKIDSKSLKYSLGGVFIGIVNGLLGAGGGMLAVPLLCNLLDDRKSAHTNSVALILPLCIFSAVLYLYSGKAMPSDQLPVLIVFGLVGAIVGTFIMKKIKPRPLRKIFSAMLVYAGFRMLLA